MRKFSLFLLLASSAVPAMALPGDGNRESRRSSHSESSDDRPQRAERSERREVREAREPRQVHTERRQGNQAVVTTMRERDHQVGQPQGEQQQAPSTRAARIQRHQQQAQQQPVAIEGVEGRSGYLPRRLDVQHGSASGQLAPRERRIRTIPPTTPQAGQSGPIRTDVRIGTRHDRGDRNRWSNNWRNDNRYNWRRHRDRNRSIFRIGFYYDPFGYSYRRFGIGSYLYPNYYQSSFWINDPWQYRLPPAYGPYRWVRYHSDAVLIDTWTGEVVDVIYGFFW